MNLNPYHTPYMKIDSKWVTDPNIRNNIIKLLEETIGESLGDFELGKSS